MKKITDFIDRILPKRSWVPLISVIAFNMLVYYGASVIIRNMDPSRLQNFSTPIDAYITFEPFFILFYILAYAQWFIGYIVLANSEREYFYKVATSEMIAKALCLACFLIIPTTIVRPEVSNDSLWGFATNIIYSADRPYNLFPSIHCLESWVVFRCCLGMKLPKWYKISMGVFTALVFASVVFVKQHFFVDIPAGILVFEIGALVTKFTKLDVFFANKMSALKNRKQKKELPCGETPKEKEFSLEK